MPTKDNKFISAFNGKEENIKIFNKTYRITKDGDVFCGDKLLYSNEFIAKCQWSPEKAKVITMCLNVSPVCNLRCKYCYRLGDGQDFTFEEIKQYIKCITDIYPNAERYILDLSGTGEPLMRLEKLKQLATYCQELSNKFNREFLPTFACNGTLLTKEVVEELQKAGILFGVSLDGDRCTHDKNRVFENGKGTYKIVAKNIKNIKFNSTVGIALTYSTPNLLKNFLAAYPLAPTISMKPVRYTKETEFDANKICKGYNKLVKFILNKIIKGNHNYLNAILHGQDYFAKFLRRVVSEERFYGRCDVGICRFVLAYDKLIYGCPAAAGIKECVMGDLVNGINKKQIDKMWELIRNDECNNCPARDACGGECIIVSYNKFKRLDKLDPTMCQIKKHMFMLAIHFYNTLKQFNPKEAEWLEQTCKTVDSYAKPDYSLIDAVERSKGKYTFTSLKRIKDNNKEEFEKIVKEIYSKQPTKNSKK